MGEGVTAPSAPAEGLDPTTEHRGGDGAPLNHRVLLKLSGDAFAPPDSGFGVSRQSTALLAGQLRDVLTLGIEVAVVVGGGNIWRGRQAPGMDRARADYIGMLATVMNAL